MIKVSVILPSYNHAPFLNERIGSILKQNEKDFELIILDDASTDNSREIIESFRKDARISHIVYNETNSGSPFLQWIKGLTLAKGNWIWFAESDDIASPYFLEKMLAVTAKIQPAFIYCDSQILDSNNTQQKVSFAAIKNEKYNTAKWSHPYTKQGKEDINESLKWECVVNNASAVLFNEQYLKQVIRDIKSFRYHGDWMIYLRLAAIGAVAYIPDQLNIYREHKKNHSASDEGQRHYRIEHYRILDWMLKQDFITQKDKLFTHFLEKYTGFGLVKEKAFGKNGIYKEYSAINPRLARMTTAALVLNKFKRKKKE